MYRIIKKRTLPSNNSRYSEEMREQIATYNAMYMLGKKKSLTSIAFEFEFELNGCQLALGIFGTNPYFLGGYLSFNKVKDRTNIVLSSL